jgi:hypothetical protein
MKKPHYRDSIREYLTLVADPKLQDKEGPTEIICLWFDDLYAPADNPKIYNPGVFEKGLKDFESCFSQKELEAMRTFHNYFNSVVGKIDTNKSFEEIQKDSNWIKLSEEAKKALAAFSAP